MSAPAAQHTVYAYRALERLISSAIDSVYGTEAISGGLTSSKFPKIQLQYDAPSGLVAVDVTIAVRWPSPVTDIAEATRTAIADDLAALGGLRTTRVNVTVARTVPGPRISTVSRRRPSASVPTAPQLRLQPVVIRPAATVRTPQPPAPPALKAITVRTSPPPRPVAPVPERTPRRVFAPRPQPLRAIEVQQVHTRPVRTAPALALQPIKVQPYEFH